ELLVVHGPSYEAGFGARLGRAGDVDGDGVPDLVVGAPHHAESGVDAGSVAVVSGADGATRFRVLGDAAGDRLGREVAGAGDVDGDGVPDLVVAKLPSAAAPGFARVLSGGRPEVRVGRTMVGALAAQPVAPDVDEVHLHAVFGTKLKIRATTLSGDLAPRVRVFGPAGETLGTLDFAGGGKKTKSLKLETTGLHRLRVEGRTVGGAPTTGTYRVETDAKFRKKSGAFTAKRSGKPGEWMSVKFHALPGAVLDARVVPKQGFAVAAPPAVRLRAPGGALLAAGPVLVFDDGDVLLAGVPLPEVGEYRIEVQAAPEGKSKMKVKVDLAQPTGDGEYAVP
ncbi:MAG: integrin alpha, partial [Planctomycetota bacterium JB042]